MLAKILQHNTLKQFLALPVLTKSLKLILKELIIRQKKLT